MAMSWGWTPLCRIGNDRYRINSAGERSSVVLSSAQCGIVPPPQLPPETSIVLTTPQQGAISSQLRPPSPTRTPVSSSGYSGSQTSTYQSATPSAEERVVRRSPRLARTSRVSYRDEGESQSRRQNQCYNPVPEQTMWNTDRSQSNSNPPASKNYSVYSYDGQVTQCLNSNSSVSIIYNNNKNIINNVPQSRYAPPLPFAKPPSFPLHSVKATPRKVTIKKLDFYEIVTTLVQEEVILEGIGPTQRTFSFILNSADVKNLLTKKKHPYLIQLRFCKLDGSCEQNDYYPTTHQLAVNHRLVLLPGLETMPRGTMRPMDITSLCVQNSQSCNFVTVRCLENCKLFVYVVQKFTSQDLLSSLEERTRIKEEDTVTEIKKKLQADQADDGIAAATLQISLLCPLSRIRIKLPCRASTCTHLQCFDAATYLQLNECKPKWSCPVCYQPALYKKLQIDGYFKKVIDENSNTDKIELQPDGTWALVDAAAGKKKPSQGTDSTSEKNSKDRSSLDPGDKTVFLDSDDDVPSENTASKDSQAVTNPPVPVRRSDSPEVVTLSDDDSPGGESPRVTASTYPTFNSTPAGTTTTTAENNEIGLESDLGYFNDLWGGAINRQLTNNYSNFHPLEHSNHLYIPLTRTPIPASLSSSITITRKSNECRTSPSDRLHKSPPDRNKGLQEKSGSSSKTRKSKTKRVRKVDVKTASKKNNSGDVAVRRKRRRILSASSDSSDSVSDRGKTPKSVHKHLTKKRPKNRRRDSESSEGEKSSVCSSNSKKSNSSVNLITSSDRSRSSSIFSSSSSSSIFSSDSDETEHSDNSFASAGHAVSRREFGLKIPSSTSSVGNPGLDAPDQPETSSRVLRSAVQRQKRKKKKGH